MLKGITWITMFVQKFFAVLAMLFFRKVSS